MTALATLTLSHFRSHRTAHLTFHGLPVALTGPNGAGKTNILEAISLLSPGRGFRRAGSDDMARRPESLGWKIAADLTSAHQVETWAEGGATRQVRIDAKQATQTALGRLLRVLWLVPAMDRLWIEAAEGRRRFLDRMTLSFTPDHGEVVLAYEKSMRDRNRLLRDQITDPHWYSALEGQMATTAAEIDANRQHCLAQIDAAQRSADSVFPHADLTLSNPELAPEDLAQALAASRRRDMAAGRTLLGPHRADLTAVYTAKATTADQCSTGEQKALLISLILANARALSTAQGAKPVLLLDEVAAHLDPSRRTALYDEICTLGVQALMTGTEQGLFDSLGSRGQYFTVAETGGLSRIEPC